MVLAYEIGFPSSKPWRNVSAVDALNHTKAFQKTLLSWFRREGKDYPWRRTQDPWHILVSEVMLQQTLVQTVLGFYEPFLKRFPTPRALAAASETEILSAWEGLGYYRRVRNLQKAAKAICEHHKGVFPREYTEILALPGIGQYTAGAVCSFAYNDCQSIVDANVARVFSRLFDYHQRVDTSTGQKQLWQWANSLVSKNSPREYNSALMELGQTYCTNRSPNCANCPVKIFCQTKTPEELPKKKPKTTTVLLDQNCFFAYRHKTATRAKHSHKLNNESQVLLQKEVAGQRREGMWKLPERTEKELANSPLLYQAKYGITHHKVTLRIYLIEDLEHPIIQHPATLDKQTSSNHSTKIEEFWFRVSELENIPMPSPFRKALNQLLADCI